MLQQRSIALAQWGTATMPQCIVAMPVLLQCLSTLPQYFRNALQHCCDTHWHNAPFVASLWQCCYCKGHCDNAFWCYCNNQYFQDIKFLDPTALVALWGKGIGILMHWSRVQLPWDAMEELWLTIFSKHST